MSLLNLLSAAAEQIQTAKKRRHIALSDSGQVDAKLLPADIIWSSLAQSYHGNIANVVTLKHWMGKQRDHLEVAVITGPCGVGKTSLVNRCARELGYIVHFFSPDDWNNQKVVSTKIIPSLLCPGFESRRCVVFENSVPTKLLETLQKQPYKQTNPILITQEETKIVLPRAVQLLAVRLQRLNPTQLRQVAKEFGSSVGILKADELIQHCQGDARRLINSIQFGIATSDTKEEEPDEFQFSDMTESGEDAIAAGLPAFKISKNPAVEKACRLVCLLRRCTPFQLADELGLLPSYRHTVESMFSVKYTDDLGNLTHCYSYLEHHDPEDQSTTAQSKLLKRIAEKFKVRSQHEYNV